MLITSFKTNPSPHLLLHADLLLPFLTICRRFSSTKLPLSLLKNQTKITTISLTEISSYLQPPTRTRTTSLPCDFTPEMGCYSEVAYPFAPKCHQKFTEGASPSHEHNLLFCFANQSLKLSKPVDLGSQTPAAKIRGSQN